TADDGQAQGQADRAGQGAARRCERSHPTPPRRRNGCRGRATPRVRPASPPDAPGVAPCSSQYTPTVVVAAKPRNVRTPLTPFQGYFADGGSRSPSSRSRKFGMNSSFVSVVSLTRPVCP